MRKRKETTTFTKASFRTIYQVVHNKLLTNLSATCMKSIAKLRQLQGWPDLKILTCQTGESFQESPVHQKELLAGYKPQLL